MAINDLAPGYSKIFYTVGTQIHTQTIPMIAPTGPPSPGDEPEFLVVSGETFPFSALMDTWADLIKPIHNTTSTIVRAEYWYKPLPESDPLFITSHTIGVNGTSAAPAVADGMLTITFRTRAGGNARLVFLETIFSKEFDDPAPFASIDLTNISGYITSEDSAFQARDNSRFFFPLRALGKASDALRRIRLNL